MSPIGSTQPGWGSAELVMDEEALIASARKGDVRAFNQLVLLYQSMAYNLAYRILNDPDAAADATQDAFISAFKAMRKFRGGSFKAWILRIVTNACYDQLRRKQRRPTDSLDDLPVEQDHVHYLRDPAERPDETLERQELNQLLQAGIQSLPVEQRMVLVLSDVQGLSYQESRRSGRRSAGHGQVAPEPGPGQAAGLFGGARGTFARPLPSKRWRTSLETVALGSGLG